MTLNYSPVSTDKKFSCIQVGVRYKAITTIHPDPQNPRQHSKQQIRQIARSMDLVGFIVPILIDQNSIIVAGHGRVAAAQHRRPPKFE